jgi:hypothetical protein
MHPHHNNQPRARELQSRATQDVGGSRLSPVTTIVTTHREHTVHVDSGLENGLQITRMGRLICFPNTEKKNASPTSIRLVAHQTNFQKKQERIKHAPRWNKNPLQSHSLHSITNKWLLERDNE